MVYHRTRVARSNFRSLRNGAVYYKSSDGTGPFVKLGRRAILASGSDPLHSAGAAGTAVADTSIAVIKIGKAVLGSQNAI